MMGKSINSEILFQGERKAVCTRPLSTLGWGQREPLLTLGREHHTHLQEKNSFPWLETLEVTRSLLVSGSKWNVSGPESTFPTLHHRIHVTCHWKNKSSQGSSALRWMQTWGWQGQGTTGGHTEGHCRCLTRPYPAGHSGWQPTVFSHSKSLPERAAPRWDGARRHVFTCVSTRRPWAVSE